MNPVSTTPILATEACHCGFPSPADDHHEGPLDLGKRLIRHPAATFFVRAEGASMEPLIMTGDLLVVDKAVTPKDQSVVIAIHDGGFVVKRVFRGSDIHHFVLKSDNPEFTTLIASDCEEVQIWGVVTAIIREL